MGIENEVSHLCAMVESGKLLYADAVRYVELMKGEYGIEEKEFRQIYDMWSRNGEVKKELNRPGNAGEEAAPWDLYKRVLDGMYEMVELKEMDIELLVEDFWQDEYEVKEDPCEGFVGFYRELPGCIGYGKDLEQLEKNMKKILKHWLCAGYDLWRERQIICGNKITDGLF